MLLGQKKTQSEEKNWCIVLNPLQSELDKKKISQTISQVFALSSEEAFDLVSNTPIILLDNLTHNMAKKVKEFFQIAGAEMTLTNDVLIKRKCYRTVWPEPPSLAFLNDWKAPDRPLKREEQMKPEEALKEIRTLSMPEPEAQTVGKDQSRFQEEIDRWQKECQKLKEDSSRLREELHALETEKRKGNGELQEGLKSKLDKKEDEVRELRLLLNNADEKYQVLKDEYGQARSLFEEKLAAQKNGDAEVATQKEVLERKVKMLEVEKQQVTEELTDRKRKFNELVQRLESLQKSDETRKLQDQESRQKAEEHQKELEQGQSRLIQELEVRSRESRHWELRSLESEKTIAELRQAYENQEKGFRDYKEQVAGKDEEFRLLQERVRELRQQLQEREAKEQERIAILELREKERLLKDLVKEQKQIEADIRSREEAIRQILSKQEVIEKEILEAHETQRNLTGPKVISPTEESNGEEHA